MTAVLQRVKWARVLIEDHIHAEIGQGFLVLLGVEQSDTHKEALALAKKTAVLRVFADQQDKMNKSVLDTGGSVLVVSNFTLCADTSHGRRPSFIRAAAPEQAEFLYAAYADALAEQGVVQVETGVFGADMGVELLNDGPVTILLDSKAL